MQAPASDGAWWQVRRRCSREDGSRIGPHAPPPAGGAAPARAHAHVVTHRARGGTSNACRMPPQAELYSTRLQALAQALSASDGAPALDAAAVAQLVGQLVHFMREHLAPVRLSTRSTRAGVRATAAALGRCAPDAAPAPQSPQPAACVRLPAALLRDTSPSGGLSRVLRAVAAYCAASAQQLDIAAPQHADQVRRCSAAPLRAPCARDVAASHSQVVTMLKHVLKELQVCALETPPKHGSRRLTLRVNVAQASGALPPLRVRLADDVPDADRPQLQVCAAHASLSSACCDDTS